MRPISCIRRAAISRSSSVQATAVVKVCTWRRHRARIAVVSGRGLSEKMLPHDQHYNTARKKSEHADKTTQTLVFRECTCNGNRGTEEPAAPQHRRRRGLSCVSLIFFEALHVRHSPLSSAQAFASLPSQPR